MLLPTLSRRLVTSRPATMPLRAKILSPAMQQSASRQVTLQTSTA